MRWEEVRRLFPDQYVKVEILASHKEGEYEVVDEMNVLGPVPQGTSVVERIYADRGVLIYHTRYPGVSFPYDGSRRGCRC